MTTNSKDSVPISIEPNEIHTRFNHCLSCTEKYFRLTLSNLYVFLLRTIIRLGLVLYTSILRE